MSFVFIARIGISNALELSIFDSVHEVEGGLFRVENKR